MHRLHNVLIATSFAATLITPGVAHAQPGERPATQLFLAPTGRTLAKGQGYVKVIGLGMPLFQGGLTDRLSVGIGFPIVALAPVVVVTPKFLLQRSATHATSVGAMEVLVPEGAFGVVYLAHTVELPSGALHVSVMTPLSSASAGHGIAVMVGAEHRLNARVTFMTENYLFNGVAPIISGGLRLKAPHTTWDIGLLVPFGFEYGARPAPMINGGWKF